jgi:hypothetical protein
MALSGIAARLASGWKQKVATARKPHSGPFVRRHDIGATVERETHRDVRFVPEADLAWFGCASY